MKPRITHSYWNSHGQLIRVLERPQSVPGALLVRVLLLLAFAAFGIVVILPETLGPGADPDDVGRVWLGLGGTYAVCYLWTPRVVARVRRIFEACV